MAQKKKYYVVWEGKRLGVYHTWDACKEQIDGFSGALYKSFPTQEQAQIAFELGYDQYKKQEPQIAAIPTAVKNKTGYPQGAYICVDAAFNGRTKVLEYRGVSLPEKQVIFSKGPFQNGTNNIGEFLGLVHALALCKQNNITEAIYTDSITALAWIREKHAKTTVDIARLNPELYQLVKRAEDWLRNNTYSNKIHKWKTDVWGEIPADYGRK
jgi:ribonuclease HI